MAFQKSGGLKTFRWSEEHRLALYLLKTEYQLDGYEETRVFNNVFGVNNMTKKRMTEQYRESKLEDKSHLWRFLTDSSPAARKSSQILRERIYSSIAELGIEELSEIRLDRLSLAPSSEDRDHSPPRSPEASRGLNTTSKKTNLKRSRTASGIDRAEHSSQEETALIVEDATVAEDDSPKRSKTPKKRRTTEPYELPGRSLNLTPEKIARAKPAEEWPEDTGPTPLLAFRYSVACGDSCEPSCLHETGYCVARKFRTNFGHLKPAEAPSRAHPGSFWDDAYYHLNRSQQESPFISVSTSLAWVLREGLQRLQKGGREVNISIILLADDAIASYHALPIQQEFIRKHLLTGGAWKYPATNEYLVWYACKPIVTIPLSKIVAWTSKHYYAGQVLRLSDLGQTGGYYKDVIAKFREQDLQFTPAISGAVADIGTSLFGFTAQTPTATWQAFVSSICKGWALTPEAVDSELAAATEFANAVLQKGPQPIDSKMRVTLEWAFVNGTTFSLCDNAVARTPSDFEQIEAKSDELGLSSPAELIISKLDIVKHLRALEDEQKGIIARGKSQ